MIRLLGGDGSSKRKAIKIIGAKNDWDGIDAEYYLIGRIFQHLGKKWERPLQMLFHEGERSYDMLLIRDEDGNVGEIWFDITDFFGKW